MGCIGFYAPSGGTRYAPGVKSASAPLQARPSRVCVAPEVLAELSRAWRGAEGREPCGYLVGRVDAQGVPWVEELVAGENLHRRPRAGWLLAPAEQLRIAREARARSLAVLGYWHGHLLGGPAPGREDWRGRARHGPALHIVVGRAVVGRAADGAPAVRAWWSVESGFAPLALSDRRRPR